MTGGITDYTPIAIGFRRITQAGIARQQESQPETENQGPEILSHVGAPSITCHIAVRPYMGCADHIRTNRLAPPVLQCQLVLPTAHQDQPRAKGGNRLLGTKYFATALEQRPQSACGIFHVRDDTDIC